MIDHVGFLAPEYVGLATKIINRLGGLAALRCRHICFYIYLVCRNVSKNINDCKCPKKSDSQNLNIANLTVSKHIYNHIDNNNYDYV